MPGSGLRGIDERDIGIIAALRLWWRAVFERICNGGAVSDRLRTDRRGLCHDAANRADSPRSDRRVLIQTDGLGVGRVRVDAAPLGIQPGILVEVERLGALRIEGQHTEVMRANEPGVEVTLTGVTIASKKCAKNGVQARIGRL